MRADVFLVDHGHASTRSQAQRLIASGVQWRNSPLLPWKKVQKNGDDIPVGAELQLLNLDEAKYSSRGGLKLEGALAATGLQVAGLRCLDVGQGQLHERLRSDARVVCVEGLNARHMSAQDLQDACEEVLSERWEEEEDNDTQPQAPYAWMRNGGAIDEDYDDSNDAKETDIEAFKAERAARAKALQAGVLPTQLRRKAEFADVDITPQFDFVTGDLSFISLTLVLPAVVRLLKPHGHLLMLVKPQFELQPGQVGKGGIVREPALYAEIEQRIRRCLGDLGLEVKAWLDSPITGGDGNHEFFVHAQQGAQVQHLDVALPEQAPATKPARVSRTVLREQKRADVINGDEEGYYNVPGPARPKRKK